jgi:hypothetical protein
MVEEKVITEFEKQMNANGWKLYTNEGLSQSSMGSDLVFYFGGRIVDFAEYKDISKQDVVEYYGQFDKEYQIVDEAFDIRGDKLNDYVAVYVKN